MSAIDVKWPLRPISGGSDADDPPGETPADDTAASPAAPPAPEFVSREDFARFQTQMTAMMEELQRGVSGATRQSAPAAPAALPAVTVTEEQIIEALAEGDHGKAAKLMRQRETEREARWEAEKLAPLRDTGLNAIAKLTQQTTAATLPHYKRFAKEIDAYLAQLPAGMRLDPDVVRMAHNAVVGQHAEELIAEAREQAIRRETTPKGEQAPGGRRPAQRGEDPNRVPTAAELMGPGAAEALAAKGLDEDAFARRLGYADWKTYVKETSAV